MDGTRTAQDWAGGLHAAHCREDRCELGCDCPCHAGWTLPPEGRLMPLVDLESEPEGCQHGWEYTGHKHIGQAGSSPLFLSPARTVILMRCGLCGLLLHSLVPGHWTRTELGL